MNIKKKTKREEIKPIHYRLTEPLISFPKITTTTTNENVALRSRIIN